MKNQLFIKYISQAAPITNKTKDANIIKANLIRSLGVSFDIRPITIDIKAEENSSKKRWLFIFLFLPLCSDVHRIQRYEHIQQTGGDKKIVGIRLHNAHRIAHTKSE